MITRPLAVSIAAIFAAAGVQLAFAQQRAVPVPVEPPPPPQYQVEILIFAYRELDPTEERFDHRRPGEEPVRVEETLRAAPVFDESSFDLPEPGLAPAPPPGAPAEPPLADDFGATDFRFRVLRPEELQLTREYQALERIPAYLPLVHAGWVQPGVPDGETEPFDLAMLGTSNPSGSVRVYLGRFLHVQLDLTYQDRTHIAAAAPPAFDDRELADVVIAPRYHLTAERNARSGELHYFDHPAFGVLVKITPVPVDSATRGTRPAA